MEREEIPLGRISEIATYKLLPLKPVVKKLLLIRPKIPGDNYEEWFSYDGAELVKQKALDLGWNVIDLAINEATRENVENKIIDFNPNLIIHYDHGGIFSLDGQNGDNLEVIIDEDNVGLLQNRVISTVSCLSADGLGPLAIANGAKGYLGYTNYHVVVPLYEELFREAANAANYALLECKSVEVAYQTGITAYNDLYDLLTATGNGLDAMAAYYTLHNRDCFVYLGNASTDVCRDLMGCRPGLPGAQIYCGPGLPESLVKCPTGLPSSLKDIKCRIGTPDSFMVEICSAGPLIQFDLVKLPDRYKKSLTQLLEQIKKEQ